VTNKTEDVTRRRLTTIFGWLAGASLGVVINGSIFYLLDDDSWLMVSTFVFFVAGAFAGMAVADRFGARAFGPLGLSAGLLVALALAMMFLVLGGSETI